MDIKDIKDIKLSDFRILLDSIELTASEESILVDIYSNPVVRKHLQILSANCIRDFAHIPLDVLGNDGVQISIIKQAYLKGTLSILQTLLSIEKPQPTSVQATQQGQSTQQ